jgi:hypothetical protein
MVACTPQIICQALMQAGLPASQEVQLTNARSLSKASIVVVTPALRQQLSTVGPSVVAPVNLASFGLGSASITIQPVYPYGGAAYVAALRQSVQNRIRVGQQLLSSGNVQVAPMARAALTAGQVDPRLLQVLQALISQQPIDILGFANSGPSASAGIPFRIAYLATTDPASSLPGSAYTNWLGPMLKQPNVAFPAITHPTPTLYMLDGQQVAEIGYPAPSPLGVGQGG